LNSIAIGNLAGSNNQSGESIAIGSQAGETSQGSNAIAIGRLAGQSAQAANSIVLNATGANLAGSTLNSFYVAPIRDLTAGQLGATPYFPLQYIPSTGEIFYLIPWNEWQSCIVT
jgi:hypothetical protein